MSITRSKYQKYTDRQKSVVYTILYANFHVLEMDNLKLKLRNNSIT